MGIFYAITDPYEEPGGVAITFERFHYHLDNRDLRVKGITFGEYFFPLPENYQQALALAEYMEDTTGIQIAYRYLGNESSQQFDFWDLIEERYQSFSKTPPTPYDIEAGPYTDDVMIAYQDFIDGILSSMRTTENDYFFQSASSGFTWDHSAYERALTYPGADPTKTYPFARYPMDIRIALEYWHHRIFWEANWLGGSLTPEPLFRWLRRDARVRREEYWEDPDDFYCPASATNVKNCSAMYAWADQLLDECGANLTGQANGWSDQGENTGTCPRQRWTMRNDGDITPPNLLGFYSFTGFLEASGFYVNEYFCDVRLGLGRVWFSITVSNQVPTQNRRCALHVKAFTGYQNDFTGPFDVELVRLPDNIHLPTKTTQEIWDSFNNAPVVDTFPVTDLDDGIIISDVTSLNDYSDNLQHRCNYGIRMKGDNVGWNGGGGFDWPDVLPMDGCDNPLCDWDEDVEWGNPNQAGIAGTCTVSGVGGVYVDDVYTITDNTFVFCNVTEWYKDLVELPFEP